MLQRKDNIFGLKTKKTFGRVREREDRGEQVVQLISGGQTPTEHL